MGPHHKHEKERGSWSSTEIIAQASFQALLFHEPEGRLMQEGILRMDVAEVCLGELGHDSRAGELLVATCDTARVAKMRARCATSASATRQAQSATDDAREVDSRRRPEVLWLAPGGAETEKCDLVAEKVTFGNLQSDQWPLLVVLLAGGPPNRLRALREVAHNHAAGANPWPGLRPSNLEEAELI